VSVVSFSVWLAFDGFFFLFIYFFLALSLFVEKYFQTFRIGISWSGLFMYLYRVEKNLN